MFCKSEKKRKIKHFIYEVSPKTDDVIELLLTEYVDGITQANEVIHKLESIKASHTKYPLVYYAIGVVKGLEKEYMQAIDYYSQALVIDPYYIEAYYNKAMMHAEMGEFTKCLKAFIEIVNLGIEDDELITEVENELKEIEKVLLKDYGVDIETHLENTLKI